MSQVAIPDGDYVLTEGAAWLTVGKASVRVHKTDQGVVVDIYRLGGEADDCLASCYILDADLDVTA